MKNKGFTLIELLAVIIILAIIALIATPVVLNVVENVKKESNKNSAYGIFEAAKLYYIDTLFNESDNITFECNGNSCFNGNKKLLFNGKIPTNGFINILSDGKISGWVEYDEQIYSYINGEIIEGLIDNKILYSWSKEYFSGPLKNETFNLIDELGINTIYQSLGNLYIEEEQQIADNILNNGYSLYQLVGNANWYSDIDAIKSEIDNVYNYNELKNSKITGLVLDIEFYVLDIFQTNADEVLSSLISTYNQIIPYAHSKGLKIILCLPYWLDGEYYNILEELIKISDGISIMNYNQNVLIDGITTEVQLAKKYDKPISHISEFQNLEEDYLTYYDEDLETALNDWDNLNRNLKYNKLSFAFHYLDSLLELEKGYKIHNYTVKDSSGNIKSGERIYVKVVSGGETTYFKRYLNSDGTVTLILPNEYDIEISFQNYDISTINEISNTDTTVNKEIILEKPKEKYTVELYFTMIEDNVKKDFKQQNIIITSKDTKENYIMATSNEYGHAWFSLNYGETYYVKVLDNNNYEISVGDENSDINTFIYNKEDGSYFGNSVFVKKY